jgi:hypothetical protein
MQIIPGSGNNLEDRMDREMNQGGECLMCLGNDGHYCRQCDEEISSDACESMDGLCEECWKDRNK